MPGNVILLYGYPMSGKTTAAVKILEYLRKKGTSAKIVSSAKSRLKGKSHSPTAGFVDEKNSRTRSVKDKAYRSVCDAATTCLRENAVPILDATFHKLYRRKWVYELARDWGAAVYVLWLVLNDEKEIKKCLKQRREAGKVSALHTWEQYAVMRKQADRLEDNELVLRPRCIRAILQFDRGKENATFYGRADGFARQLAEVLAKRA